MFKTLVVGTDGSSTAAEAVRQAAQMAKSFGAELHLVSAFRPVASQAAVAAEAIAYGISTDPKWDEELVNEIEEMLSATAEDVAAEGVKVTKHALAGEPAEVILDVAENVGADLIVVGSKGLSSARRFLLGSVPSRLSHHAKCNLMIVHTT